MCILVDANAAGDLTKQTEDGVPVLEWLLYGQGRLVLGGKLTSELAKGGLQSVLADLNRAGRIKRLDEGALSLTEARLKTFSGLRSNDLHVIAMISVSRCSIVFTKDKNLHKDLKNKLIISKRPAIYQTYQHSSLLTACRC